MPHGSPFLGVTFLSDTGSKIQVEVGVIEI